MPGVGTSAPIEEIGVKVREIWELALPPGTILAGGEAGLGRVVEWVAALRAVFPLFGTLGEGYLLTPGYETLLPVLWARSPLPSSWG